MNDMIPTSMNESDNAPYSMAMTVEQMAAELHISRNTAYALVQRPDFPSFRIGKRVLVNRELLQSWMNKQCM